MRESEEEKEIVLFFVIQDDPTLDSTYPYIVRHVPIVETRDYRGTTVVSRFRLRVVNYVPSDSTVEIKRRNDGHGR